MSIPDEIIDLRRKKYLNTLEKEIKSEPQSQPQPQLQSQPQKPVVVADEESIESILARLLIYEQDEKLARELDAGSSAPSADISAHDASIVRPPIASVVDCLLPSVMPLPFVAQEDAVILHRSRRRNTSVLSAAGQDFRLKRWRCYACRRINLAAYKICMNCGR